MFGLILKLSTTSLGGDGRGYPYLTMCNWSSLIDRVESLL